MSIRYFSTSFPFWFHSGSNSGFALCLSGDDPIDHLDLTVHLCTYSLFCWSFGVVLVAVHSTLNTSSDIMAIVLRTVRIAIKHASKGRNFDYG